MTSVSRTLHYAPLRPADLPAVARWLAEAGLGLPPGVAREALGRRLVDDPRIVCLGAREGQELIGFLRLDLAPDRTAELTLLVAPERRRRGVGLGLLERALAEARGRGLRALVALVQTDNAPALAFFQEAGFEETGQLVRGFVHLSRVVHRAEHQPPLEITP